MFVEKKAMEAYKQLKEDLEKEDIHIDIDTGYRSVAEQEEIMQRYRERYGLDYVKQYVAVPGYSEHQSALTIDLYLNVDGKDVIYNEDLVKYTDIWDKIHAKLADYGFILRYSKEKEDVTKFSYEPWHIRYVGSPEIAKDITDKGLALEEYLGVTIEKAPDTVEETLVPVNTETLYQVALLQSLVQGYYDGILSVAALKERGDIGIGTFDGVNGELIMLDGVVYRAGADGTVEEVDLINAFKIEDIDKRFVILSKGETIKEGMSKIYVSEFVEEQPGVYSLVGINDDNVWDRVKQAMKQIVEG